MSSPNQTAQPAAGGNPFLQSYQAWAVRTPVVTRYSTIVLTIVYILTWFFSLESLFANVPFYTLFYFEVYRLILSPLVGNSLLTLILVYLVYPSLGVKMETSMGSAAFLYLIVFFTLAVNVLFLLVCLLFVMFQQYSSLGWVSMDFWTLLFALITLDCMQMPDMPRRLMFIPVDISSKYIPLVLYFILCLFSGFVLSYALSLAVGYLWMRGKLDYFRPSSQFLERQESEGGWLYRPSRISGWVLAGSLGHDAWIPVNTVDPSDHGSSAHGGQPQGGTYFGGAGGPRGSSDGQNPMHEGGQQPTAFPGSGRKLADSSSSTSAPSSSSYFGLPVAAASFGGTVARPPSAVVVPVATPVSSGALPSREEIAARRLAALEAQQRNFGNMASAPPLPSDHNHNNV